MEDLVPTSWPKELYTGNPWPSENDSLLITRGRQQAEWVPNFPYWPQDFLALTPSLKWAFLISDFYGCCHIAHVLAASLSKIHDTFGIWNIGESVKWCFQIHFKLDRQLFLLINCSIAFCNNLSKGKSNCVSSIIQKVQSWWLWKS
jgi:hypothetical protein